MNSTELIERILALEETSIILECSRRVGRRLGIRGGVIRNLAIRNQLVSSSLFDYVDAFSDLDCVVDRGEDWSYLASALASSLPYAGFYRWEIQTFHHIKLNIGNYPAIPSERVIVWFHGSSESEKVYVEDLNGRSQFDLSQITPGFLYGEVKLSFWEQMLMSLRVMRVLYQYLEKPKDIGIRSDFERTKPIEKPSSLTINRLQQSLAHLTMSAINLRRAIDGLRTLDEVARHVIQRYGGEFSQLLLSGDINEDSQITTSIYNKGRKRREVNLQVVASKELARGGIGGAVPLLPWTSLNSPHDPSCCEYRDFSHGVAVIASRGPNRPTLRQIESAQIVSLLISEEAELIYELDQFPEGYSDFLPVPGILTQASQGIALRIDHAFPSAYFGRSTRFVTSALAPGGSQ